MNNRNSWLTLVKNLFVTLLVLLLGAGSADAQRTNFVSRYMNRLLNDTTDITKPQFLMYPTVAFSPETSWEFGLSSVFVFYAKRDPLNRLSEVNGFTFVTLENQYGAWFEHALYSDKNLWFSLGRLRFQSFPLLYYGIGSGSPKEHLAQVNANLVQIKERVLRKVYKSFYAGLEVDYQALTSVGFIPRTQEPFDLPTGNTGSRNLGLGAGILYDNRHNILNVRKGFFSELALLRYNNALGSDFTFNTIISDTRIYHPVNNRDVLAFQLLGQFNQGVTPFNQLALLGGENIMRGYYQGRYRDKNQIATQLEYRFLPLKLGFTERWGAALFAGAGTVFSDVDNFSLNKFVLAGGGGIRFLLFPKKDIFTRLDVAFTREGTGIYIFIGEAF